MTSTGRRKDPVWVFFFNSKTDNGKVRASCKNFSEV